MTLWWHNHIYDLDCTEYRHSLRIFENFVTCITSDPLEYCNKHAYAFWGLSAWFTKKCFISQCWMCNCVIFQRTFLVGYPSLLSHHLTLSLNNPLIALHGQRPPTAAKHLAVRPFQPMSQSLPCDVHLLNLRSLVPVRNGSQSLLFLHRVQTACGVQPRAQLSCDSQSSSDVCFITCIRFHSTSYMERIMLVS